MLVFCRSVKLWDPRVQEAIHSIDIVGGNTEAYLTCFLVVVDDGRKKANHPA